jgi:septal ring factor EnvC (AmiA/AmiB activator)
VATEEEKAAEAAAKAEAEAAAARQKKIDDLKEQIRLGQDRIAQINEERDLLNEELENQVKKAQLRVDELREERESINNKIRQLELEGANNDKLQEQLNLRREATGNIKIKQRT